MPKYRKKPVVIEAMYINGGFGNFDDICEWAGIDFNANSSPLHGVVEIFIDTMEGEMKANQGDYIIKGVKGEFYPCKPDIFEMTYELLEDN